MTEKNNEFLSFDKEKNEILNDFRIDTKQNGLFVQVSRANLLI